MTKSEPSKENHAKANPKVSQYIIWQQHLANCCNENHIKKKNLRGKRVKKSFQNKNNNVGLVIESMKYRKITWIQTKRLLKKLKLPKWVKVPAIFITSPCLSVCLSLLFTPKLKLSSVLSGFGKCYVYLTDDGILRGCHQNGSPRHICTYVHTIAFNFVNLNWIIVLESVNLCVRILRLCDQNTVNLAK